MTRAGDHAWERIERELLANGSAFPLASFAAWYRINAIDGWLVSAHRRDGRPVAAFGLESYRSRALPGHRLLRARNVGAAIVGPFGPMLVESVRQLALREPRILRVTVELVLRTPEEHAAAGALLRRAGFVPAERMRNYRDTLVVDLAGTEEAILRSFSETTRRDLRALGGAPIEVRKVDDQRFVARLDAITRETFARTGTKVAPRPWPARIALSAEHPEASRLVGLFRAGRDDQDSLLAYAWGCAHGDHAHYDDAGSTRVHDLRVSLMYPLMWDLIRWAKRHGCTWFDLGGATRDPRDPRAGITGFKRRFSKEMVEVGAEWTFEPHPRRAQLVRLLRSVAGRG